MTDLKKQIADGALARAGLLDTDTIDKAAALVGRVAQSDLETVRVLFADQHGILRGKTIVAEALASIFTNGLAAPSTLLLKDTAHKTVFHVWSADPGVEGGMAGAGDILMLPDPDTFRILPWSPHSAWVFCDPRFKSGEVIPFSPRDVLKRAIAKLADHNMALVVGLEVEFHVFDCVDPMLEHSDATMPGQPAKTRNLAPGYQFLTETHYGALEPVMDDLRRHCQALGLPVRSMEVEMGPSQFEFTFDPADPLTHADNMMMFRAMVKESCARKGLHATFMCKPNLENAAASGWHLHQSVVDRETGRNLMVPSEDGQLSDVARGWIAGLLSHAEESCLLTTPTVNGYKRYRPHQLAPDRIQWGRDNRGTMIRGLMAPNDPASRIENRVAETTANPYYFFASQILSGLDGIRSNLPLPDPVETPYTSDAPRLPESLLSAIRRFEQSDFFRAELGDAFVDYLTKIRRAEWDRYHLTISEWEQAEYFGLY
ncbi:glutamine synthetase [Sulfitobacter sp. SK012]|uniref:glutamine synthetase family protein n=1 Tax=Sulfitobacter sp. SK012 TaxID=1389005 RepID=UPI000E0C3E96|nr:glutamine synthetase family protein [Sulfitobacter sp. SK012]AXI45257.1 glutamine synthetase [Sulfitobacter sp. SK012]